MDIFSDASELLDETLTEFSEAPFEDSIGISTVYTDKQRLPTEYEVRGRFPTDDVIGLQRTTQISQDLDLYETVEELFTEVVEQFDTEPGVITSISLSQTRVRSDFPPGWRFYSSETADAVYFVKVDGDITTIQTGKVETALVTVLSEFESGFDSSQICNYQVLFSDLSVCEISSVEVELQTAHPEEFFDECDSIDQYIEAKANSDQEEVELREKDSYTITYPIQIGETANLSDPVEDLQEVSETVMSEYFENSLDTELECIVECEGISVGGFDYASEGVTYFLHIPVTDGELGVSR